MENNGLEFLDETENLALHNTVRMEEAKFKTYLPMFIKGSVSEEERENLYVDYFAYSNANAPVAVMRGNKVLFVAPPLGTRLNVNMEGMDVAQRRATEMVRKGYPVDVTNALYNFVAEHSTNITVDNTREVTWAGILQAYGIAVSDQYNTTSTEDSDEDGIEWDFD